MHPPSWTCPLRTRIAMSSRGPLQLLPGGAGGRKLQARAHGGHRRRRPLAAQARSLAKHGDCRWVTGDCAPPRTGQGGRRGLRHSLGRCRRQAVVKAGGRAASELAAVSMDVTRADGCAQHGRRAAGGPHAPGRTLHENLTASASRPAPRRFAGTSDHARTPINRSLGPWQQRTGGNATNAGSPGEGEGRRGLDLAGTGESGL